MKEKLNSEKLLNDLSVFILFSAVALMITSLFMIKEDVYSTTMTLLVYFPLAFEVNPASDLIGALALGAFVSLTQVVTIAVALNDNFLQTTRIVSIVLYVCFMLFDGFTDITHRSQYLTGNIYVASAVTFAFYTMGAEILSGFSGLLISKYWRRGISDIMLFIAGIVAFFKNVAHEWSNYRRIAGKKEERYISSREQELGGGFVPSQSRPQQNQNPQMRGQYSQRPPQQQGQFSHPNPGVHPTHQTQNRPNMFNNGDNNPRMG